MTKYRITKVEIKVEKGITNIHNNKICISIFAENTENSTEGIYFSKLISSREARLYAEQHLHTYWEDETSYINGKITSIKTPKGCNVSIFPIYVENNIYLPGFSPRELMEDVLANTYECSSYKIIK